MGEVGEWPEDCLRWWGRILVGVKKHWCPDWDYLPIDETCDEMQACTCVFPAPPQEGSAE